MDTDVKIVSAFIQYPINPLDFYHPKSQKMQLFWSIANDTLTNDKTLLTKHDPLVIKHLKSIISKHICKIHRLFIYDAKL